MNWNTANKVLVVIRSLVELKYFGLYFRYNSLDFNKIFGMFLCNTNLGFELAIYLVVVTNQFTHLQSHLWLENTVKVMVILSAIYYNYIFSNIYMLFLLLGAFLEAIIDFQSMVFTCHICGCWLLIHIKCLWVNLVFLTWNLLDLT